MEGTTSVIIDLDNQSTLRNRLLYLYPTMPPGRFRRV